MKTLKMVISFCVIAFFTCGNISGQILQQEVVVTISGIDYGPGIGIVTGTYTYQYSFRLDEDGKLESMHWNVVDNDLTNEKGDKVIVVDSGHDTYGGYWILWNNINLFNTGWNISYAVEDGWLDEMMPATMPIEGTTVSMSTKIICKGTMIKMGSLLQLHINANGVITAEVIK